VSESAPFGCAREDDHEDWRLEDKVGFDRYNIVDEKDLEDTAAKHDRWSENYGTVVAQ
jgi:hypothetical protein